MPLIANLITLSNNTFHLYKDILKVLNNNNFTVNIRQIDLSRGHIGMDRYRKQDINVLIIDDKSLRLNYVDKLVSLDIFTLFPTIYFSEIFDTELASRLFSFSKVDYIYPPNAIEYLKLYLGRFAIINPYIEGNYNKSLRRFIEFPPEYHQAGISILHEFSTVLQRKYPDKKAKVQIEQDGLKVKMTVIPVEGETEFFEKALDDYALMLTGQTPIKEYTDDRYLAERLQYRFDMAAVEIRSLERLLSEKDNNIKLLEDNLKWFRDKMDKMDDKMEYVIGAALRKPDPQPSPLQVSQTVNLDSSSNSLSKSDSDSNSKALSKADSDSTSNAEANIQFSVELVGTQRELMDLAFQLPSGVAGEVLNLAREAMDLTPNAPKEEVKDYPFLQKAKELIESMENADSTIGKVMETTGRGITAARKLAGHYNKIAQWCGMPQVPEPFVTKE